MVGITGFRSNEEVAVFVGGDVVRLWMPLLAKRWRRRGDDGEEMLFVLK